MTSKPKKPFRLTELQRLMAMPCRGVLDVRDRAIAAVGYFGLLRRSELVALTIDDIAHDDDGSATITIRNSKTDQEGEGKVRYLAALGVTAVRQWLLVSGISDGCIFRRILANENVAETALLPQEIARVMKRLARQLGLNAKDIAGHSLRIGAAHDLVSSGFGLPAVMQAGGWNSPTMPAMYTRELAAKQSAMALMVQGRNPLAKS